MKKVFIPYLKVMLAFSIDKENWTIGFNIFHWGKWGKAIAIKIFCFQLLICK